MKELNKMRRHKQLLFYKNKWQQHKNLKKEFHDVKQVALQETNSGQTFTVSMI
uniref:Uncharacterized protein n=1 Tax=Rhizophora mucronata TaxID=61149 RepID=A0A2P2N614_RHIMU